MKGFAALAIVRNSEAMTTLVAFLRSKVAVPSFLPSILYLNSTVLPMSRPVMVRE